VSMTSRKGDRSRAIKADIKSENSLRWFNIFSYYVYFFLSHSRRNTM
jgi:hypothetical protein